MTHVAIIGAGPAGLMAAEAALAGGARVDIFDAMPSAGRKFLMAGKSGLNITHSEDEALFRSRYDAPDARRAAMVAAFGPADIVTWMAGLGIEALTGSSGRVFPVGMKASPLLRRWLARLGEAGAVLHTRHRWTGWDTGGALTFETMTGQVSVKADTVALALGGASWRRLGSDGAWASILARRGIALEPFAPSNCGFLVSWSAKMAAHEGAPVKGVSLSAHGQSVRGDFVITRTGIESGAVYPLAAALRRDAAGDGHAAGDGGHGRSPLFRGDQAGGHGGGAGTGQGGDAAQHRAQSQELAEVLREVAEQAEDDGGGQGQQQDRLALPPAQQHGERRPGQGRGQDIDRLELPHRTGGHPEIGGHGLQHACENEGAGSEREGRKG